MLSREPAFRELLGPGASDADVRWWGGVATMLLMVGWATGGILFGILSDRHGRVRAMAGTLVAYTVFSGLSGFAKTAPAFLALRFLFGIGVGGMFGTATTLVAESVPARMRTFALGTLQALSSVGTMSASALSFSIKPGRENLWGHFSGWQVLCFAGVFPVVLAAPMIWLLKEPELWKKARAQAAAAKSSGSMAELFRHPRWRRNTLAGLCLGVAGMVGLWGIAFFSPELITTAFKNQPFESVDILKPDKVCQALSAPTNGALMILKAKLDPAVLGQLRLSPNGETPPRSIVRKLAADLDRIIHADNLYAEPAFQALDLNKAGRNLLALWQRTRARPDLVRLNRQLLEQVFPGAIRNLGAVIDKTISRGTMLQDVGAVLGMFAFTFAAAWFNRRTAFFGAFLLSLGVLAYVFASLKTALDVDWMLPMVGFVSLAPFAGYSIYFPELFPTRLRGTGVGFCYNTVRYLAAPFPFLLGWLSTLLPFRTVAVLMCGIYLVGLAALAWAPETKGQPLPED